MKILVDTHVAPALGRWSSRLGLALVVAIAIGYVPGDVLRRDPRALKLDHELHALLVEAARLERDNAQLAREVGALRSDVSAIEERARTDLGMVYPDEVVLLVERAP